MSNCNCKTPLHYFSDKSGFQLFKKHILVMEREHEQIFQLQDNI